MAIAAKAVQKKQERFFDGIDRIKHRSLNQIQRYSEIPRITSLSRFFNSLNADTIKGIK